MVIALVFAFACAAAALNLVRRRESRQFEVALLLGTLAVQAAVPAITQLTGVKPAWSSVLSLGLLLLQPYLLLRLLMHFREIPHLQHGVSLGLLIASAIALLITAPAPPVSVSGGVLLALGYVESFIAVTLVREARRTRGVTRGRLMLLGIGAGLLALSILVAGVNLLVPKLAGSVTVLTRSLGGIFALCFYFGFAPPGWLRRTWQRGEFQQYLQSLAGLSSQERLSVALDGLGPAATRAIGGKAGITLVQQATSNRWRVHLDPESRESLATLAALGELKIGDDDPQLTHITQVRQPFLAGNPKEWGPQLRRLAEAAGGAGSAVLAPVVADGRQYGAVVVFFQRHPLFLEDDLPVLALLADEAAVALALGGLFDRLRESNAALEEASRLKSAFLATMSHELRTPLNAIIGFSELLIDEPEGGFNQESRQLYAGTIHSSGRHLLSLINDVLDLSKIEAGKMDLHPEAVDASQLIERVIGTVSPLAARKGLTLVNRGASAGTLTADDAKLKQILYNLLANAIKFTPAPGRVTVDAVRGATTLHITVSDTGIGIAPAEQDRIFQEFHQVDSTTTRQFEGTGLGLALTRRLVELHGGRIWVESILGQGSRFHFNLPLRAGVQVTEPGLDPADNLLDVIGEADFSDTVFASSAREPNDRERIVLVIEDDPNAASILCLYLSRGQYRPVVARSGHDALDLARTLEPVAITLDVLLPDADGWQVLEQLKQDQHTRDVPVVVISIVDDEERAQALGVAACFVKPVDRQALLGTLDRILAAPAATLITQSGQ
jgi:signal transduction histidine kinase/CheY-like chemotaxis protein